MLNKVILMGRLTHTPELKSSSSGLPVLSFSLAVERNYAPKGEERQTDFIPCVAWRQTAEFIAKYFPKGAMIVVEGSLQTRKYEARDGSERTAYEVIVDNACFAGDKREEPKKPKPAQSTYYVTDNEERSVREIENRTSVHADDFENVLSDDGVPF